MPVDWGLLNTSANPFAKGVAGYEAGQKMRTANDTKAALNLFATDPAKGVEAMTAAGRPDLAAAAMKARSQSDEMRATDAARPFAAKGDYRGASSAAAGIDLGTAKQLEDFNQAQLDHTQKLGERSAQVLMAASQLPEPQDRKAFLEDHTQELSGLGYSPEHIASYDTSDPTKMRADAARFMSLSETAGKMSTSKFGDYSVTYETNPVTGTHAVAKSLIPPTRADKRAEREFDYRKGHDAQELEIQRQRESREAATQANPDSSPSKVMGPIYRKLANGQPLTRGEQEAMKYYKLDPLTADALSGDDQAPQPAPRPGAGASAPAPAAAPAPPASAPPPRALSALTEGRVTTFKNGQRWTLKGGRPVQVN